MTIKQLFDEAMTRAGSICSTRGFPQVSDAVIS
jgi:hypothetical protein